VTKKFEKLVDYIKAHQDNESVKPECELPFDRVVDDKNPPRISKIKGKELIKTIGDYSKRDPAWAGPWQSRLWLALEKMCKKYNKDLQDEYNPASTENEVFYKYLLRTIKNSITDDFNSKNEIKTSTIKIKITDIENNFKIRDLIPKSRLPSLLALKIIGTNLKIRIEERDRCVSNQIFYDDRISKIKELSAGKKIKILYKKEYGEDEYHAKDNPEKRHWEYQSDPSEGFEKDNPYELLEKITEKFPKFHECEKLLTLRYAFDLNTNEMANKLKGLSEPALRKRVSRCKKNLDEYSKKMGIQS
jgi:hypothetical protein